MLPAEHKKQAVILGVLLLVLAVINLRPMVFSGGGTDTVPSDDNGPQASAVSASALQWQPPEPLPADFRDPMVLNLSGLPRGRSTENQPIRIVTQREGSNKDLVQIEGTAFYLRGIVYHEENPSSIITDQGILHQGDSIHGIRVKKIMPNTVEFQKNDHIYHVRVGEKTTNQ